MPVSTEVLDPPPPPPRGGGGGGASVTAGPPPLPKTPSRAEAHATVTTTTTTPIMNRPSGPTAWSLLCRSSPLPPPPRRGAPPSATTAAAPPPSTSSVSSPTSRDTNDEQDVESLLEGIDRVRIDDLWSTPRSARAPGDTPDGTPASHADPSAASRSTVPTPQSIQRRDLDDGPPTPATISRTKTRNKSNYTGSSSSRHLDPTAALLKSTQEQLQHQYRTGLFAPPANLPNGIPSFSARTRSLPQVGLPPHHTLPSIAEQIDYHSNFGWGDPAMAVHVASSRPTSTTNSTRSSGSPVGLVMPMHGGCPPLDLDADFPRLFKVYPCPDPGACALTEKHLSDCFFYHSASVDRRREDATAYKPHMCRFVEEAGGCRKADRCPFSHNDFERRYHPERFGKETCRDFLRGDCPRRYCTFRHEVSGNVETALVQIDSMGDKELLQLVLKLSEEKGRSLSEKLLRRFGHGKKHSGWRLEGFNPSGRDDQKVKFVSARIDILKKLLRTTGEKKWATSLKTSSLRDMMSGVRKVAEEVRERFRDDPSRGPVGPEMHRLIRAIFSNTNWSCHSQEGDNPFLVTPENQNDAVTALERLLTIVVTLTAGCSLSQSSTTLENQRPEKLSLQSTPARPATTCPAVPESSDRILPFPSTAGGTRIIDALITSEHYLPSYTYAQQLPSSSMFWGQ